MHQNELKVSNLSYDRGQNKLFKNISFTLTGGEVLFVEGINGSGKSSLLRLITGIATPSSGTLFWCNKSRYGNHIHYIGHQNGIKLGLTVLENLQLAEVLLGKSSDSLESVLNMLRLD